MLRIDPQDKARLIDPLFQFGPRYRWTFAGLLAVAAAGAGMYFRQLTLGLGETGMSRPSYWGIYIVNFIFMIGVSMAGTLISASLHLLGIGWRRPLTRIAETLTVAGLLVAGVQILVDMGRPERMLFMGPYGRLQSPLLWDAVSLTTYILASMTALYLELLPDIGILRDNLPPKAPDWRKILYTVLALNWRGTREQWQRHHLATTVLSVAIIPIGVSLHTVTSWILSTTVQPGWKSTILGPYFVVGAIFSGLGLLLITMSIMRQWLPVKGYLTERLYANLGWVFIFMNVVWFYFTYTETLTVAAEQETMEFPVLASKLWGEFAVGFWAMAVLMVIAFWVMVVPRLLPRAVAAASALQPRVALTAGAAFAAGLWVLAGPLPVDTPVKAALGDPALHTLLGGLLAGLLLVGALGLAAFLKPRPVLASVIAAVCVVAGMWLERWNIIIPTLTHPRLVPYSTYAPTVTELSITAASIAFFGLMFLVFFKLFPAVSLWEVAEGRAAEGSQPQAEAPDSNLRTRRERRWGVRH
jgi:Ni/Fe-hydrogenase subunit HybB-like protein